MARNTNKDTIEALAVAAQKVPQEYRWIFAQAFLLEKEGNPRIKISKFSGIFSINWLANFVLIPQVRRFLVIGSMLSVFVLKFVFDWKFIFLSKKMMESTAKDGSNYFIGFGAAAEESMLKWYQQESLKDIKYVSSARTLRSFYNISLIELLKLTLRVYFKTDKYFSNLPVESQSLRFELYWSFAKNVAYYCYWLSFFKKIKNSCLQSPEVLVIHTGISAFAAVSQELPVRFVAHGLLRHSIVFPDFEKVEVMTISEKKHVQKRLPNLNNITLQKFRSIKSSSAEKSGILLVSAYGSEEELDLFEIFSKRARALNQTLFFRPRPWQKGVDILMWPNLSNAKIIDQAISFEEVLVLVQPSIVASTVSAALVDAECFGSMPIVMASNDDRIIVDMVFPMLEKYHRWPQDNVIIEQKMLG